ncbi:FHA domain-containing protein [Streptomyces sp. ISL-36]|uniref:FHA domain-containing protein n=1 Tax=Streptomyces sp. ISL-36 TaxID=2819182 RepID=UPI001BE4E67F|nr:FHA domain-containing protein [Streptomyces sp. ISL-36]MBT2444725.1 FHA domain-containing protein [Streptomyces sp. ISL-36]
MPTCPNGHQSVSDDWCEVCGHRMAGAGAPAGAVPPPPPPPPPAYGYPGPAGPGPAPGGYDPNATAQAELCPQCRTPREAMAPFCEECRWNFQTNTATSYTPVAPPSAQQSPPPGLNLPPGFQSPPRPQQQPQQQQQPDPYEYQSSRPSQMNRPAEPLSADPTHHQAPPQRPPMQQGPPPQAPQQPQAPQGPQAPQHGQGFQQGPPPPPPSFFQGPSQAPPQQQQPQAPARADDDWMLPPPSQPQRPQPPQQQPPSQPQPPHHQQPPQQQHAPQQPQQQPPQQQYQPPQPPRNWSAFIGPDRDYFMAMMQRSGPEATGLNLPAYSPEQHLPLQGNQISIGRRRHSTGESPDIDLSVPPEDPGVSHQHAVLVQQPDGSWAVVDQNSTNGTTINGAEEPIQPYVPVPLQDGDRVHVGAWTTITIRRG